MRNKLSQVVIALLADPGTKRVLFLFLDLSLVLTITLLTFTRARVFFFHLIFVLLTLGAFYWQFPAFVLRALMYVISAGSIVLATVVTGETHPGELIEFPMLSLILVLVFMIARERSKTEQKLRHANLHLEHRVTERTSELHDANKELALKIAERRLAEASLREISAKSQAILNVIPDTILRLNQKGTVLDFIRAPQETYRPHEILLGALDAVTLQQLLPPSAVKQTLHYVRQCAKTGKIQAFEYQHTLDGKLRDFEMRLITSGDYEILAIIRDITDAAQLQRERTRIFRNLHDDLGQIISYLRLKLDVLIHDLGMSGSEVSENLNSMMRAVNQAYDLIREMLATAQPTNLANIETALLAEINHVAQQSNLKTSFSSTGHAVNLSPIAQQQIIYIFKEALTNVVRHAQAQNGEVRFKWEPDNLMISLIDDGQGFDPGAKFGSDHYGLRIMHERAWEINGELTIKPNVDKGTSVILKLPIERSR